MSVELTTIGSGRVTIEVKHSPFPEAAGGVCITYSLYDGPLTVTLTIEETRALIGEIIETLTTPAPWSPAVQARANAGAGGH